MYAKQTAKSRGRTPMGETYVVAEFLRLGLSNKVRGQGKLKKGPSRRSLENGSNEVTDVTTLCHRRHYQPT